MLVDLVGVNLVQNVNLFRSKAALVSDECLGFFVGHQLATVGKVVVVALAHVRSGAGAGLPLKLTIQIGVQLCDLLLAGFHLGFVLLFHLDQLALELHDLCGSCLAQFLFAAVLHERLAKLIFVAVEVVVGVFDLRILAGGRLEAGALDKLRNHHFCVPP